MVGLLTWSSVGGASTFFGFVYLNWSLCPRFNNAFFPSSYGRLTRERRLEWDARIGSSVHAIFCCLVCLLCWLWQPKSLFDDPKNLGGSWWLLSITMVVMSGYMLADVVAMMAYMTWREMAPYGLHHCLALICFLYCMQYSMLQYFALFRLISELSTPFVNFMWFFRISGYRDKAPMINAANSAALALSFAMCRILLIPFYWLKVLAFLTGGGKFFIFRFPVTFVLWMLFGAVLDVLNVIWFRRILIGGMKVWRGRKKQQQVNDAADGAVETAQ